MRLGETPKKIWKSPKEMIGKFNRTHKQLDRLMILDYAWNHLVGNKAKFWVLKAVQGNCLFVETKVAVAKNELMIRREQLIKELNKYFETPWIKKIEVK